MYLKKLQLNFLVIVFHFQGLTWISKKKKKKIQLKKIFFLDCINNENYTYVPCMNKEANHLAKL